MRVGEGSFLEKRDTPTGRQTSENGCALVRTAIWLVNVHMRPGFLSAAKPRERAWISLKGSGLAHHVCHVNKKLESSDRVRVELADGAVCVLPAGHVHVLPERVKRPLTVSVKASERTIVMLLSKWFPMDSENATPLSLLPELIDHILSFLAVPRVDMAKVRAISCSSIGDPSGNRCSLDNALNSSTENWWISAGEMKDGVGAAWIAFRLGGESTASEGSALQPPSSSTAVDVSDHNEGRSAPEGAGQLASKTTSQSASVSVGLATSHRVEQVTLCIPPLPFGPLSVRDFHLETSPKADGPWERCTADLTTLDTKEPQPFQLHPPIEAAFLRIVCTKNAARASAEASREAMSRMIEAESEVFADVPPSIGFYSIAFA